MTIWYYVLLLPFIGAPPNTNILSTEARVYCFKQLLEVGSRIEAGIHSLNSLTEAGF